MVLEGLGVSIMSRFTAHDFADRGVAARPFSPEIYMDYMMYVPRHRPMSRLATAFVQTMNAYRDEFLA